VTGQTLERYVDGRELAQLMGVSERTIKRMTAAGMPSETWGLGRTRRFLPSEALAWARNRRTMLSDNPPEPARQRRQGPDASEVT
jgi:predicted DNA-binding transcriptional regulator AlpA